MHDVKVEFSTDLGTFVESGTASYSAITRSGTGVASANLVSDKKGKATVTVKALEPHNSPPDDLTATVKKVEVLFDNTYHLFSDAAGTADVWADDDFVVYVNGKVVFENLDGTAAAIGPIKFEAKAKDTLRIKAINAGETGKLAWGVMQLTPVYLKKGSKVIQVHPGEKHGWDYYYGNYVFVDQTMEIPW